MQIRPPCNEGEREAALALADREYRIRSYADRLEPLDGPNAVLLAAVTDQDTVVGTISLVLASDTTLPTESYFGLSMRDRYPEWELTQVMEIGRLAVSSDFFEGKYSAFCGLLAGVQLWADARGVKLGLMSLKATLQKLLGGMGIGSHEVAGPDNLNRTAVPTQYRGYFFPADLRRRPSAYVVFFDAIRAAILQLPPYAAGLVEISPEIAPPYLPYRRNLASIHGRD